MSVWSRFSNYLHEKCPGSEFWVSQKAKEEEEQRQQEQQKLSSLGYPDCICQKNIVSWKLESELYHFLVIMKWVKMTVVLGSNISALHVFHFAIFICICLVAIECSRIWFFFSIFIVFITLQFKTPNWYECCQIII